MIREFFNGLSSGEKMDLLFFAYIFVIYISMILFSNSPVAMRVGDMLIGALLTKIVPTKITE